MRALVLGLILLPLVASAQPSPTPRQTPAPTDKDDDWNSDGLIIKKAGAAIKKDNQTAVNASASPQEKKTAAQDKTQQIQTIKTIAEKYPDKPEAQQTVAETYSDAGEPGLAKPYADHFVALAQNDQSHPERVDQALTLRGTISYQLHDFPAARRDAQAALARDPRNEQARTILALSQNRSVADVQGAIKRAKNAGLDSPGAASQDLGSAGPGKTAAPSDPLPPRSGKLVEQNADLAAAQQGEEEARRYLGVGDTKAALLSLEKSLAKAPRSAGLLALKSQALLKSGDAAGALAAAGIAVAADAKSAEAHFARAQALEAGRGAPEAVLADYKAAQELDARFTPDYTAALAKYQPAGQAGPDVDANGIGTMGRKGLGFNPQGARDQLFAFLPPPARKFAPVAIIAAIAGLIAAIAAWLKRQGQP